VIRDFLRAIGPASWAVIALCVLLLFVMGWCALDARRDAAQDVRKADAGQTLAEGRTAAAQDASAIRDQADARDQSTASIVTQAEKEIRHAPDRNAAADAARRRVCQLSDYRDAQCAVFRLDPGRVD